MSNLLVKHNRTFFSSKIAFQAIEFTVVTKFRVVYVENESLDCNSLLQREGHDVSGLAKALISSKWIFRIRTSCFARSEPRFGRQSWYQASS